MSAALTPIAPRLLGQLIRLLASDHDGECLAAARALRRTLHSAGQDFHSLADSIEKTFIVQSACLDWTAIAEWLLDHCAEHLSEKEFGFVCDMRRWGGEPTERQAVWLQRIYQRERGRGA
jgi:hypothetical protein